MWRTLAGYFLGYLVFTEKGKTITKQIIKGVEKDVNSYLTKEGIIEPNKDVRPSESGEFSSEFKKQPNDCSTINE